MTALAQPIRRLADSFGRIFTPEESPALLCPKCDKVMTQDHECKPFVIKRRFFLGLLGASTAALVLRDQGVPIRTARTQVWANSGDMLFVEFARGERFSERFTVAYDQGEARYSGFIGQFGEQKNWNPNLFVPEFSSVVKFNEIPSQFRDPKDTRFSGEFTFHPQDTSLALITLHPSAHQVRLLNVRDADSGDSLRYTIFRMGKPLPADLAEKRIALRKSAVEMARTTEQAMLLKGILEAEAAHQAKLSVMSDEDTDPYYDYDDEA
jgi:hypothetical protein